MLSALVNLEGNSCNADKNPSGMAGKDVLVLMRNVRRKPWALCTSSGAMVRNQLAGPYRRIMASSCAMQADRSIAPHGEGLAQ